MLILEERSLKTWLRIEGNVTMPHVNAWLALGVLVSTAATDAVYVLFTVAVSSRRRISAANWSSLWYLLSAFAVISYTKNWAYVGVAAAGSWIGAYASISLLRQRSERPPPRP